MIKEHKGTILFAGNFQYQFREFAMARALKELGWQIEPFSWEDYTPLTFIGRILFKYMLGRTVKRINADLLSICKRTKPDIVFLCRPNYISTATIMALKSHCRLIATWNPDNPFGGYNLNSAMKYKPTGIYRLLFPLIVCEKAIYFRRLWSKLLRALPLYDICFVYRSENIEKYKQAGVEKVYHLPSFYDPALHRPMTLIDADKKCYERDVVFIGHFEPDGRVQYLEALLDNDIKFQLYGQSWNYYLSAKIKKMFSDPIRPIFGINYTKTISGAKIALCFLSKLNLNQYTRRCFEIPACRTLLLCERTPKMQELFMEDREAVYFSDPLELVAKVKYYLAHPAERNAIAVAGYERCMSSGYDVANRMKICDEIFNQELFSTTT
ncbi:hypothetical protein A2482_00760 [Candidatus Falkowbacteria bacterium RIFOXYC2_FULL_48_21]|uniref:Spore protein YkvP/CgeB glycosyl transferase-like domain-containing protein n=1 Tax=Candidatus Falkowbacteria bacterium RIFOXYC2_FULL_48_21 TaxID=1798005 RepID=A0A1F5T5Q7_9BACT|nr:MAG: hypothetical protein A2482_00760 [Candidatus Falkowbacteria bacterium RIFOXYC2_FULL_48_21]